jgi:uncharacterized protein with FMN-binding domain
MFRKTVLLITGTVAGVVGVVGYNPPQLDAAIAPTGATPLPSSTVETTQTTADAPSKANSTAKPTSSKTATKNAVKTKTQSPAVDQTEARQTPQSSGASGVFQGNTMQTRWGPVQVEITVTDGKITNVSTLQYPNGDRRSLNISNQVLPWLQQEVLRTQSTNITGISGATYTSNGFKASLASALQKAGL